ncbi:MAG: tRNA 4-thiouridine(8) synthase ThiI [Nanoarchaeota archaeon]|nr:tRNA 4-thiouridine(8) synthase ThiI [Nanoarchaeota archaeon]
MMKVIIHYNEIGLKGKNRIFFETKLYDNIKDVLEVIEIKKENKRFILDINGSKNEIESKLKNIFGIENFCFVTEVGRDVETIITKAVEEIKKFNAKEIALKTKRSDKSFELNSIELNKKIGEEVNKLGMKINFSNPEKTLFIEITSKNVYIYSEKIKGLGGLPVGSSGKVLCLLSGGIDSALAAYYMMKRGCNVGFLHFHVFPSNKNVLETKIKDIIEVLNKYQNKSKLFLIPYNNYQRSTIEKIPCNLEVISFKNFMLRTAERLARKKNYKAIVVGDSIGQVASQTLSNLNSSREGVGLVVLSPLIGFDKQEIIDKAIEIGTYEASIEKYMDCCSIVAKKPNLGVKNKEIKEVGDKIDINKVIEESLKELEVFEFKDMIEFKRKY